MPAAETVLFVPHYISVLKIAAILRHFNTAKNSLSTGLPLDRNEDSIRNPAIWCVSQMHCAQTPQVAYR